MTIDILDKRPSVGERLLASHRVRFVLLLVVAIVMLSIQSVVAREPSLRTDLATLIVVYLAMEHEFGAGLVMTLLTGYVADVFSGEPRGLYMASLVILFLGMRLIVFRIVGSRWFIVTTMSLLSTLAAVLVRIGIESLLGAGRASLSSIGPSLLATFLVAGVAGYPVYTLLRVMEARFRRREDPM